MTCEICVWVGGDRNHLSLWDRLDGHTAAVKEEVWPWTEREIGQPGLEINQSARLGGNHRVVRVRGASVEDLIFLRQHGYRMAETRPGHFEHDSMARCGVLLPEHVTSILVNLPPGEVLEIDKAFLLKDIRIAPEWPTLYMSHADKAAHYRNRRLRKIEQNEWRRQIHRQRVVYWRRTTAICPAMGKAWRHVSLEDRRERSINSAVVAFRPKRAA